MRSFSVNALYALTKESMASSSGSLVWGRKRPGMPDESGDEDDGGGILEEDSSKGTVEHAKVDSGYAVEAVEERGMLGAA